MPVQPFLQVSLLFPEKSDGNIPVSYTHLDVYKRQGGRHPMGHIGINTEPIYFEIPVSNFSDMRQDKTLKYKLQ